MTTALTFGGWLKRRRSGLGLTQKELAHRAGYAAVTLRKVEADELRPSRQMAQKLAEALELEPEERGQFVRFARDEAHWDTLTLPGNPKTPVPAMEGQPAAEPARTGVPVQPYAGAVGAIAFASNAPDRSTPKHNLPAPATPLIGREQELAELAHLLANPGVRLVTILAAGGMGKTHLAIAAARQQLQRFAHGVCWVGLAPLLDAQELVLAIAAALGLQLDGERTPVQQVGDYLRARRLLLVLDNFEHLLDGAPLLGELLAAAPQLSILVTSRERLKLSSELVLLLDGLPFPTNQDENAFDYPAVQMFLLHAHRLRPHHQPDKLDVQGILEICCLVDGMPLGILLAAAWSGVIAPSEIAAEIARDMGFLQADMQDIPARQRNLHALFLHTWGRLGAAERDVFMRLSVFRGGASVDAAMQVTGATLGVLRDLIDKALLWRLPGGRYAVHELLRQFAAEQLAAAVQDTQQDAHRQHSRYYLNLLVAQEQQLQSQQQRKAVDAVRAEFENIAVAWRWAVQQHEIDLLAPAAQGLFLFCDVQGDFRHGGILFEHARMELESDARRQGHRDPGSRALLGQICTRLGVCEVMASHYTRGVQLLRKGLSITTNDSERALALVYQGLAAGEQGDFSLSRSLLYESLELSRRYDEFVVMVRALHFLELGAISAEAHSFSVESLALARRSGRPDLIAGELNQMGWHKWCLGDYAGADACWQEGLALCRQLDFRVEEAWALDCLGFAAWGRGDLIAAESLIREALAIDMDAGRVIQISMCMADLSLVLTDMGRLEEAIALAQQTIDLTRTVNCQMFLILSLNYLGGALLAAGDYIKARLALTEALQRGWEHQFPHFFLLSFYYFADLLERESHTVAEADAWGRRRLALASLYCVCTHPGTWQVVRDKATVLLAQIKAELPAVMVAAVQHECASRTVVELVGMMLMENPAAEKAQPAAALLVRPDSKTRSNQADQALVETLSERELEILRLLAQGYTNQQIADALTVVVGTVKTHIHHIFGKLGVSNRVQAVARARELNLL